MSEMEENPSLRRIYIEPIGDFKILHRIVRPRWLSICPWRDIPHEASLATTQTMGISWRTAVSNSMALSPNDPSP